MTDLQMKRHNWFPSRHGVDECAVCSQPDFPEVGIFCPGPKPATPEPDLVRIGRLGQQAYGRAVAAIVNAPKPPTTEAPAAALEGMIWHDTTANKIVKRVGGEWVDRDDREFFDGPQWDTPRDPITDFIARRVARRGATMAVDLVKQPFGSGRKPWPNSLLHEEDQLKLKRRDEDLDRAMSTPNPHDTDIHTRLMPYRGK